MRRGAGAPELLLEPPKGLLVPRHELHLELAKATDDTRSGEYRDRVVDDLRAVCSHGLPPRAQPRDRRQLAAAQEADEQSGELEWRACGEAGLLELDPRRPARELQLPDPGARLDPVPERDAVSRQHEIGRVVVGRGEAPGRQGLTAELRQDEALVGGELDFALELLLHGLSVTRTRHERHPQWTFTCVSFRLTCPPVRLSLTPKTSEFFVLFARAGDNALEVARLVERRFREHPNSGITQEQVKAAETRGDGVTRDLIQLLNTQYLTPFDRDDIYMLAIEIDDVVDDVEEASDLLGLYGIERPTKHAIQQTALIVAAAEQLKLACDNLKSFNGVQDALVEVKRLEDEGDGVLREGLAALFRDDRIDPLVVIRWKDVYDRLERALDSCETAANVIANIVMKNA